MIGAVVLAAGASSRMGVPKATLATPDGATFLEAIRATLRRAGVDTVRVVVAPSGPPVTAAVINPDPARGMLSSVQCGLRALPEGLDAVLLWPVDHPLVTTATVTAMLGAFRAGDPPIVVPTHGGRRGHPVLFARRLLQELLSADPGVGARAVVRAHADRLELDVPDPGVATDIDTPEDYRRLLDRGVPSGSEVS